MWAKVNSSNMVYSSDSVNGSTGHYLITNLRPVTNYTVKVYAKNERGKGKTSDDRNISTLPTCKKLLIYYVVLLKSLFFGSILLDSYFWKFLPPSLPPSSSLPPTVPGPLIHLQTHQLTAYSVHILYTISPDTGGSPITTLRIVYQAGNDTEMVQQEAITVPLHTYTYSSELPDLKGDTPYLIRVSVGNGVGLFGPETKLTFRTLHPTHPPTPTSVVISEIEATSVELSWNVASVGRPYTEYRIHALEPGSGSLSGGTLYTFKPADISRNGMEERVKVRLRIHYQELISHNFSPADYQFGAFHLLCIHCDYY